MSITIFLTPHRHHKIQKFYTQCRIEAEQLIIDVGGLIGLILTMALIILTALIMGKKPQDIIQYLRESGSSSRLMVTFGLLAVSAIAIWLTMRVAGLYILRYLFTENYRYNQYEILELISYILIVNLCFNLTKSLRKTTRVKDVASAAIQALLIGVIVLLPKSSSVDFLDIMEPRLQGVIGFLVISISSSNSYFSHNFLESSG